MKIGVNFSLPALKLLREGAVSIDLFKVHENEFSLAQARESIPSYIHFDLFLGSGDAFDQEKLNQVRKFLEKSDTAFINTHLAPTIKQCLDHSFDPDCVYNIVSRDLNQLIEVFGKERILVENINPDPNILPLVLMPQFISRVVREHEVGFLLDVSHAVLASKSLDMSLKEYLELLPLTYTREVHLGGAQLVEGYEELEGHAPFQDMDRFELGKIVKPLLERFVDLKSCIMTLEYGGSTDIYALKTEEKVLKADLAFINECFVEYISARAIRYEQAVG